MIIRVVFITTSSQVETTTEAAKRIRDTVANLAGSPDRGMGATHFATSSPPKGHDRYSADEIRLLTFCGVDDPRVFELSTPIPLYRSVAVRCFIRDFKGKHIDALRRACRIIEDPTGSMRSSEFKEAIKF